METIRYELLKAQTEIDLLKMVDNFNKNALIEKLLDRPSADLRKYFETLPLDTLRKVMIDLNKNAIASKGA